MIPVEYKLLKYVANNSLQLFGLCITVWSIIFGIFAGVIASYTKTSDTYWYWINPYNILKFSVEQVSMADDHEENIFEPIISDVKINGSIDSTSTSKQDTISLYYVIDVTGSVNSNDKEIFLEELNREISPLSINKDIVLW